VGELVIAFSMMEERLGNAIRIVSELSQLQDANIRRNVAIHVPWLVTVGPDNARPQPDAGAGCFSRFCCRTPARIDPGLPGPMYLDPVAIEVPMVALGAATWEALRMVDELESMRQGLRDTL
jgi:hypothetical protein